MGAVVRSIGPVPIPRPPRLVAVHGLGGRAERKRRMRTFALAALTSSALALLCMLIPLNGADTPSPAFATGSCEADGCGAAAMPPHDASICNWGAGGGPAAHKPPGCAYCAGGQCVDKLPNGSPAGGANDCQSNQLFTHDELFGSGPRTDVCEAVTCVDDVSSPRNQPYRCDTCVDEGARLCCMRSYSEDGMTVINCGSQPRTRTDKADQDMISDSCPQPGPQAPTMLLPDPAAHRDDPARSKATRWAPGGPSSLGWHYRGAPGGAVSSGNAAESDEQTV